MTFRKMLAPALAMVLCAMPVTVYADDAEESAPETETPTTGETTGVMPSDSESGDATAPETATQPATQPAIVQEIDPGIRQLQDYYAEEYGKQIRQKSRLAKLVGIISLSKIDAGPLTDQLITAISENDPIVSQLAWEAVLARSSSLTPEQRLKWTQAGLKAADSGAFPGTTVAPLLEALAQYPIKQNEVSIIGELLERLCKGSDPSTAEGEAALDAGGRALVAWNDPKIISRLFNSTMSSSKPRLAERAARMFSQFPNAPKDGNGKDWRNWLRDSRFKATPANQLKPFNGVSMFFPPGEKIIDPNDPKWVKDAELPELRIASLRTVFCLDATGSGINLNEFVTQFIDNLGTCIDVAAERNQMGAIYYRHEIDPKMMAECCVDPGNKPDDFRQLELPLTQSIAELVHAMRTANLGHNKGHDKRGAAYIGALQRAHDVLGSSKQNTISVVALFGDAKGTEGKEEFIPKVTQDLVDDGIQVFFLTRQGGQHALREAIEVSKNESIPYEDDMRSLNDNPDQLAIDIFPESAFGQLAKQILASALPKGYSDRSDQIVNATAKILRARDHAAKAKALLDEPMPEDEQ